MELAFWRDDQDHALTVDMSTVELRSPNELTEYVGAEETQQASHHRMPLTWPLFWVMLNRVSMIHVS